MAFIVLSILLVASCATACIDVECSDLKAPLTLPSHPELKGDAPIAWQPHTLYPGYKYSPRILQRNVINQDNHNAIEEELCQNGFVSKTGCPAKIRQEKKSQCISKIDCKLPENQQYQSKSNCKGSIKIDCKLPENQQHQSKSNCKGSLDCMAFKLPSNTPIPKTTPTPNYYNAPKPPQTKTPTPNYYNTPKPPQTKTPTPNYYNAPKPPQTKTPTPSHSNTPTSPQTPTPNYSNTPTPPKKTTPTPSYSNTPTPPKKTTPTPSYSNTPTPPKKTTPTPSYSNTPTPPQKTTPPPSYSNTPKPPQKKTPKPPQTKTPIPNYYNTPKPPQKKTPAPKQDYANGYESWKDIVQNFLPSPVQQTPTHSSTSKRKGKNWMRRIKDAIIPHRNSDKSGSRR